MFRNSYVDSSPYYYNCCIGLFHVSIPKEEKQKCKISRCRSVITWAVRHKKCCTPSPPVSF